MKCNPFNGQRRWPFILALLLPFIASPCMAGFSISGTTLLDGNGQPFVMRGINHSHTWFTSRTPQAIEDIAQTGANTVRIVLSSGDRWQRNSAQDVADVISQLKAHHMIAVLEVHDTTGYGEEAAAASLASATDYWISLADVLKGEEDYVIINIGNEPIGNYVDSSVWINGHRDAIQRLREAGFTHTLLVDAPSWGQDWRQVMLNNASTVAAADPLHNTMFSVHMYAIYSNYQAVEQYVSQFLSTNQLPLIVGEFAADTGNDDAGVAEDAIMEVAEAYDIGYLGWSWSGNSGASESELLDIALNFNADTLSVWGDRLINGVNGIRQTSELATVFTDDPEQPTPPDEGDGDDDDTPPTTPSSPVTCSVASNEWGSGYQLTISVSNVSEQPVSNWQVQLDFDFAPQLTNSWNASLTTDQNVISAANVEWNGQLAVGATTTFGLQGTLTGPFATPTCSGL